MTAVFVLYKKTQFCVDSSAQTLAKKRHKKCSDPRHPRMKFKLIHSRYNFGLGNKSLHLFLGEVIRNGKFSKPAFHHYWIKTSLHGVYVHFEIPSESWPFQKWLVWGPPHNTPAIVKKKLPLDPRILRVQQGAESWRKQSEKPIWRSHKLFPSRSRLKKFNKISRWTSQMAGQSLTIQQSAKNATNSIIPRVTSHSKKKCNKQVIRKSKPPIFRFRNEQKNQDIAGFLDPSHWPEKPQISMCSFFSNCGVMLRTGNLL